MGKKPSIFTARLAMNRRITIPEELRKIWVIEEGDSVEVQILSIVKNFVKEDAQVVGEQKPKQEA